MLVPITHDVFGDESPFNNAIAYGIVVVPVAAVPDVEHSILALKERMGVPGDTEIHCNVLFNDSAKSKTVWAIHSEHEIEQLLSEIAVVAKRLRVFFRVGLIDKRQWPKVLPADGEFPKCPLDDKQLCGLAFQAAVAPLEESVGIPNVRLWVDYDHTKIPWFGKKRQAYRNYRSWSGISKQWLEPQPKPNQKPPLLQLADIVSYVSSHALCVQQYAGKKTFERLYRIYGPEKSVLGP